MKTLWFRTKTYGWGWTPATWQGWLCIVVYVLLMCLTPVILGKASYSDGDVLILTLPYWLIYTAVLVIISALTGEKPRWRWGK